MIKKLRLVKLLTGSLGAVSLLSFGSSIVTSCSKKDAVDHTLANFLKSAKAESATNVIKNASPKAQAWNGWLNPASTLTTNVSATKTVVTMVIDFKSSNEKATFTATYTKGQTYKVDVWKCIIQPANDDGQTHTEAQFISDIQKAIIIDGAGNDIATKATPSQSGWKNDDGFKVISALVKNANHTVTLTVADRKQSQKAVFTATYTLNRTYQTIDWSANGASATNKDDLDFSQIVLPGAQTGTAKDYVTKTIEGTVYVGGVGGLWSSTDDKTFTKVKMNDNLTIDSATKVIGIVEQGHSNIFVATTPVSGTAPNADIGLISAIITPGTPAIFFTIDPSFISRSIIMTSIVALNDKIYLGTTTGIFKSAGAGNKWLLATYINGPGALNITKLEFMNGKIWAATKENGLWRNPVNSAGKDDDGTVFSKFTGFSNLEDGKDVTISWMKYIDGNSYVYIDAASYGVKAGLHALYTGAVDGDDTSSLAWAPATAADKAYNISSINNEIYLSTNTGIYISPKAKSVNFKINDTLGKTISVLNVVAMHDTLYAITNKGLYTSAGFGLDYFNLSTKLKAAQMDSLSTDGTHVFIKENASGLYTSEIK